MRKLGPSVEWLSTAGIRETGTTAVLRLGGNRFCVPSVVGDELLGRARRDRPPSVHLGRQGGGVVSQARE